MEQVGAVPADRSKVRIGETIAAGIAEYDKDRHDALLDVFEEADKAMYEKKQRMKDAVLSDDFAPDSEADTEYIPVINVRKRILIADDVEMSREMLATCWRTTTTSSTRPTAWRPWKRCAATRMRSTS